MSTSNMHPNQEKSGLFPSTNPNINPTSFHPKFAQNHTHQPENLSNLDQNPPIQSNLEPNSSVNHSLQQMNLEQVEDRDTNAEAIKRLEEQLIRSEKVEVSEEERKINEILQEDEVLALEAIYGDSILKHYNKGGLRFLVIHVHLEVPSDFRVSAKLSASIQRLEPRGQGGFERSDEFDDSLYSFKVKHLPPVVLTCLLPLSYPSCSPPCFSIFVQWLDAMKVSSLCEMLDNIWNANPAQEVLYKWVEWLHSSSLPFLDFDDGVRLAPYDVLDAADMRSISGRVSLEVDIPSMVRYNDEKCHEEFINNLHQCDICYNEYAGSNFIELPCRHKFCIKCMETYSDIHVKDGTVTKLVCPVLKCEGLIPPDLLRRLLGSESYDRWESLLLQKTLDSMPDVVYCPRCETVCLEDEDHHIQCVKCFFSFCAFCREGRHVGFECISQEKKLLLLQERQNNSKIRGDRKRKQLAAQNEFLSLREVLRSSRQCPCCMMAISRTEGCNKMVCQNCGQFFCYRCGQKIKKSDGYNHFKQACPLFPEEEVLKWEMRINRRDLLENINWDWDWETREIRRVTVEHPCPTCLRGNAKVSADNQILCCSCRSYYCALCRKVIRPTSGHFNGRVCKRYTADA